MQVVLLGLKLVKLFVRVAFGPLEPASVAWSEIVPPAVACGVALVVTVGEAFLTSLASVGPMHARVKPRLIPSPVYLAIQRKVPARTTGTALDGSVPSPLTTPLPP